MNNRNLIAAVVLALAVPAGAIELSLEENRAERGNIGYVDTQRLFKLFPETVQARENFAQAVRQAEDQINMRKAEILRLRKEIGELKVERAALAKSTPTASATAPIQAPPPPPPVQAPAPVQVPAPVQAPAQVPAPPTTPAQVPAPPPTQAAPEPALPGFGPAPQAAQVQPLVINLPGATTGPVEVAPPAAAPAPAVTAAPPAAPAPAPVPAAPVAVAAPAAAPVVSVADAQTAHTAALSSLDERIAQKEAELARREAQAREEQAGAEKNLLDLESRRSEILLGKIYRAVQEIARREGVSVVVDKTGILYGHNAVDLTEKVLKHLKGG